MANNKKTSEESSASQGEIAKILPGTPEMEAFLAAGYPGMTVAKAEAIIKERQANPQSWPYEVFEQAQAYLAAYRSTPQVISTREMWKRDQRA
jgi:hypothetical protein